MLVSRLFQQGCKAWGVSAQVYALKSRDDFGIGGFSEIATLAKACGERGASFLGLSPLHALCTADRSKYSPYSPSNRLMLEPLFIDPRMISGFAGSSAQALYETSCYQLQKQRQRKEWLIDYHHVWALLQTVLEPAWKSFCPHADYQSFAKYKIAMGAPLVDHALFEALSERFSARGMHRNGAWPRRFHERNSAAVIAAHDELSDRVDFYAWLQWITDQQLHHAAKTAKSAGMAIGLYRDLAVGADPSGSEIWRDRSAVLRCISIGAPPDLFAPQGQNWGLPPLDPERLEMEGLRAFRDLVRANMRHAGAIRIDHAFQLERLFLIPDGAQADAGAYVDYPLDALLACLRIESHRAKALVVAEDLGTAPPGFVQSIMDSGLLSSRLMLFERDADNGFMPPETYQRQAMARFTTHDLPTLQGWRRGLDIDMRNCYFGLPGAAHAHKIRGEETQALDAALEAGHLLPDRPDTSGIRNSVFRFLARTPAMLLTLQAEDIVYETHQPNLPGPDCGYPNWRRRMEDNITAMSRPEGSLAKAAACMALEKQGLRSQQNTLASEPPCATYRLQFNANFTFADEAELAPYFAKLGISHIYASPIYAAAPESTHNYDVIDYTRINPLLGGEDAFMHLSAALQQNRLKLIVDFVPNHISKSTQVHSANLMWLSTLESGRSSPFARVFDIDWDRHDAGEKILLPVLDESLNDAIGQHKIKLRYDAERGGFFFSYRSQIFRLRRHDYTNILAAAIISGAEERLYILTAGLQPDDGKQFCDIEELKSSLCAITQNHLQTLKSINSVLSVINADAHHADPLAQLLQNRFYRLAHWRIADTQSNTRRFFDVNSLIGVRVEDPYVFDLIHSHLFGLIDKFHVHGLRIDHIDGPANPEEYLKRLQQRVGPDFFIIVEKILGPNEDLQDWQIAGTTGYEAMSQLDGVFIAHENNDFFDQQYESVHADERPVCEQLKSIKIDLLQTTFLTERDALVDYTLRIAEKYDLTRGAITDAWMALIADMPVYRSYLGGSQPCLQLISKLISNLRQDSNVER